MGYRNLSNEVKFTKLADASAAGTTAVNSTGIDMAGYDGIMFVLNSATITSGAVTSINAAESTTVGGTYADLLGTGVTVADDDDDEIFWIDVSRPRLQFIRLEIARATQNSAWGPIYALQYRATNKAVDNSVAGSITGELHLSPAQGTA